MSFFQRKRRRNETEDKKKKKEKENKRKKKCYPQSWKRMCRVELATRVLCINQRVSKFQSTSPKLMWFVDHVRISGASAQSLGVDTRSPNGDDHWWDTHVKSEKWNKRRHTANFISASSFPPIKHRHRYRTAVFFSRVITDFD